MPHIESDAAGSSTETPQRLPFAPVTYSHILHCSYDYWQPRYRTLVPKSRIIPLPDPFVSYLRADGIVLPPETTPPTDNDIDTFSDDSDVEEEADPSKEWEDIHAQIKATIAEFGGKVTPKLNWSAPKDATWMSATNDLQCRTPNDIYLLLKSSDFITHDLDHPFDDCVPDTTYSPTPAPSLPQVNYHLVLRKYVNFNPSLEFRCFVRNRVLLCICQRDQNHFDFLFTMRDSLRSRIQSFFDENLKDTFPDSSFVFDVYIPPPHQRVWLIDINPWAERTDPLLFSWLEILRMKDPVGFQEDDGAEEQFVRLSLNGHNNDSQGQDNENESSESEEKAEEEENMGDDDAPFLPEFRLIKRDDPEAYAFTTPQYSAHKLPKEVVDASISGPGGMSEFLGQWQDILARQAQESDTESDR
ncbi:cell division cycle protein [Aspergillus egyptiacus]|nr:cell division cycle protein [Aspergillus egyptiacus]